MNKREIVGIEDYQGAAAGWGALKAVAGALRGQMAVVNETHGLLTMNQPHGFDCPGCAWPDPKHTSSFEFCENGAKAVSWEATSKRTTPEFFAAHTVSELGNWWDFDLENQGRLTQPMAYDRATDNYLAVGWEEASRIGAGLRASPIPNGGVLHLGTGLQRSRLSLPVVRARLRHQQFPRLLEHVPRSERRRPAGVIGVGKGTVKLDRIRCISELEDVVVVGEVAYTRSRDRLSVVTRVGGEATQLAGYRMTIYRKQPDGRWLLARDAHTLSPVAKLGS